MSRIKLRGFYDSAWFQVRLVHKYRDVSQMDFGKYSPLASSNSVSHTFYFPSLYFTDLKGNRSFLWLYLNVKEIWGFQIVKLLYNILTISTRKTITWETNVTVDVLDRKVTFLPSTLNCPVWDTLNIHLLHFSQGKDILYVTEEGVQLIILDIRSFK